MSQKTPFYRYRPIRANDGAGGVVTSLGEGVVMWGVMEEHQNELQITGVHKLEDVKIGDEIVLLE